jgi:SHS2 domain-containing protein
VTGRFEIVEHTADVGIRGRGSTLDALFAAMAEGLFAIIADPRTVGTGRRRTIALQAASEADLLHDWLEELNALHQVHSELYRRFEVRVAGTRLEAVVRGEAIDLDRHDLRVEVKAVTWHDLRLEQADGRFEAFVLLDI